MDTIKTAGMEKGDVLYIAKKGKKYVGEQNGELSLKTNLVDAICFKSKEILENFIDNVTIDDRNARLIGRSYSVVPITKN